MFDFIFSQVFLREPFLKHSNKLFDKEFYYERIKKSFVWVKFTPKLGHRKLFIIGLFWAVITLIPLIFFQDLWTAVLIMGILGFGVASIYYANQLVFSDCIDEIVIDTGKRQEGVFLGIRTFF